MEHNILWTSGWDSTYRVLDLVLNKKRTVQPFYVLDNGRASTEIELQTMEKLKNMIILKDPEALDRIKPIIKVDIKNIPPNEDITNNYKNLANISHLGGQYDWLARLAKSKGIKDLELSIHRDDTAFGFIKNDVYKKNDDLDDVYLLKENPSLESLKIFRYYRFPLLDLTKLEMESNAKKFGFDHIMEKTWFCHSPIKNQPCGMCNPCKYTRDEGLGRRVPNPTITDKIMRFASRVKRKGANVLKLNW